jgi:hypothetical protein
VTKEKGPTFRSVLTKAFYQEPPPKEVGRIGAALLGRARRLRSRVLAGRAIRAWDANDYQLYLVRIDRLNRALRNVEAAYRGLMWESLGGGDLDQATMDADATLSERAETPGQLTDLDEALERSTFGVYDEAHAFDVLRALSIKIDLGREQYKRKRGKPKDTWATRRAAEAAHFLAMLRSFGIRKRSERALLRCLLNKSGLEVPSDLDRLIKTAPKYPPTRRALRLSLPKAARK